MEQKENGSNTIHMPVVGIGASAGGLKAFENFLTNLMGKLGLEGISPPYYGTWSGRSDGLSYQDIIIVQKKKGEL